jgi:hypothetical protein
MKLLQRSIKPLGTLRALVDTLIAITHVEDLEYREQLDFPRIIDSMRGLFAATQGAGLKRSLAAHILADQLLKSIEWALDTSSISKLRELGARISGSRTEGPIYESSWITEARTLDPSGEMGDLALQIMFARGFQLLADCSDCGDCFVRIIREGEDYLARAKDSEFRTWTHSWLAQAYADVVAIGSGYDPMGGGGTSFQMTIPEARTKAVAHYLSFFGSDTSSTMARSDWREAWRIVAAIPPEGVAYICIND